MPISFVEFQEMKTSAEKCGRCEDTTGDLKIFDSVKDFVEHECAPSWIFWYVENVIKGKFPQGEEIIAHDAGYSYEYAKDFLKGRFEEGENIISHDAIYSYCYAVDVLKERFLQSENVIKSDKLLWEQYKDHFNIKD